MRVFRLVLIADFDIGLVTVIGEILEWLVVVVKQLEFPIHIL